MGQRSGFQPESADRSRTVIPPRFVHVGQQLHLGSLGVCSSLMGNFMALTSFTLLTGLFPKQLLIYKGYNILYRVFWCGTQQSLLLAGGRLAFGRKALKIRSEGAPRGSADIPADLLSAELQGDSHRCLTFRSPTACFQNFIFFFFFTVGCHVLIHTIRSLTNSFRMGGTVCTAQQHTVPKLTEEKKASMAKIQA